MRHTHYTSANLHTFVQDSAQALPPIALQFDLSNLIFQSLPLPSASFNRIQETSLFFTVQNFVSFLQLVKVYDYSIFRADQTDPHLLEAQPLLET